MIEESCGTSASIDSAENIQNIIMFLYRINSRTKHVDPFLEMLSLMESEKRTQLVLPTLISNESCVASLPRGLDLFYDSREKDFDAILEEMERERSVADIIFELGYGCTLNSTHCRGVLSLFLPLTENILSRILSTFARTHLGLDNSQNSYITFLSAIGSITDSDISRLNTWNSDVLVDSIKQLAPATNWVHVMEKLDHEGFFIPNQEAFSFFMSIFVYACKEPFPIHSILGSVWENVDGQLSFLKYAVSSPPDIFTFDHSTRRLEYADVLSGYELPTGHAYQAWLSLDLLEALCQLAERGHANSVRQMLEFPLKHCPEILILGIAQITTAYNLLQRELFSTVIPMIIGMSFESAIILHLWHSNRKLVIHGFVDVIRTNESYIDRILDICHELQILSVLLDQIPFAFSNRLAAFSSQKEYLCLEKWLNGNLTTRKDVFYEECLKFLKEVSSVAADNISSKPFQHSGAALNISAESSAAFFKALQDCSKEFGSEKLFDELLEMHHELKNYVAAEVKVVGFEKDIEAEANFYFHQIFSSTLTIGMMIQKLTGFKESSDIRQKSILDCMIQSLFEEYQFFPNYPKMQLEIAAILLGSLIKHQLVTDIALGIALRCVLDALCDHTDSKLFAFGIKALEQFLDCLEEWPQYSNHILQVSHIRCTHPQLVPYIERAFASTSSGSKSNTENMASTDTQSSSTSIFLEKEVPDSSGQVFGSSIMQLEKKICSPLLKEQRHQVFSGDEHELAATSDYSADKLLRSSNSLSNVYLCDASSSEKLNVSESFQTEASQSACSVPVTRPPSICLIQPSQSTSTTSVLLHHSHKTVFGSALNIETLVSAAERRKYPIEAPDSDVGEKIFFIINNISPSNLEAKCQEFIELFDEQYYPWFAQYIVIKRASIEPNFHDLYLEFLDKVNLKTLIKEVVKAAYENCKVLLRSELIKSSSEERSLLKNMGSFLGKLTLGRNLVLRASEINLKALIIEAYERGLMIAVIPFTSKILESCQTSVAYRPPNPWTMGILSLLVEIYILPNLKMNIIFDIELLFKNLSVDINEVHPSSLLKDCVREVKGNYDFSYKEIEASHPQLATENNYGMILTNKVGLQSDAISPSLPGGNMNGLSQLSASIPNHKNQIASDQQLSAVGLNYLQRFVPIAMQRAIKQVIVPVVEESISIAKKAINEFVLRDYITELDENRIYNAIHSMAGVVAGNYARLKSKGPLFALLYDELRNAFQGMFIPNELLDKTISHFMNDSIDNGCSVIAQCAEDQAIQIIEREMAQRLKLRRNHRKDVGQSYYEASMYTQGPMGVIPESLRPTPGHLSRSQQRVYEDFNHSALILNAGPSGRPTSENSGLSHSHSSSARLGTGYYSFGPTELSEVTWPLHLIPKEIDQRTEFLGSSIIKPLFNTKDALDKYQIVSVKDHSMASKDDFVNVESDSANPDEILRGQVSQLFDDWCKLYELHDKSKIACTEFISHIQQIGFLHGDDMTDRFFWHLMEITVENCLSSRGIIFGTHTSFLAIDVFAKLVVLITKYCVTEPGRNEKFLLPEILSVIVRVTWRDAHNKTALFNPTLYLKVFINCLLGLLSLEDIIHNTNFDIQVLIAFANAFHALQPLHIPAFSLAWFVLVSHRNFMPKLLTVNSPEGFQYMQMLLVDWFKYIETNIRNPNCKQPIQQLCESTMKLLHVLLRDFPEFLCGYHFSFCDVIPYTCIQLRNIVLSASPHNANSKIELTEKNQAPPIFSEVEYALKSNVLKSGIDNYLKKRYQTSSFFSELNQRLLLPEKEAEKADTRYNIPLINSLVLYVGMQAIERQTKAPSLAQQAHSGSLNFDPNDASIELFQTLITELDAEGRYIFLNAIANQLRYVNSHTCFFSMVLLYLFGEANQDIIQEQITRTLLERRIMKGLKPWGLLVTFDELIKNPDYNFWNQSFLKRAPDIVAQVKSVSRDRRY